MFNSHEKRSNENPTLRLAPPSRASQDVSCHFSELLALLEEPQLASAELRQLWLETHWLKSDFEQNVLRLPTNWELMLIQIAEDRTSESLRQHVEIVEAAKRLGLAIKEHLVQTASD